MEMCGGRTIVMIFFKKYISITAWKTLSKDWAMTYLHFSFFCKQPYNLDFQEDILRVAAVSNMAKIT